MTDCWSKYMNVLFPYWPSLHRLTNFSYQPIIGDKRNYHLTWPYIRHGLMYFHHHIISSPNFGWVTCSSYTVWTRPLSLKVCFNFWFLFVYAFQVRQNRNSSKNTTVLLLSIIRKQPNLINQKKKHKQFHTTSIKLNFKS